MIIAGAVQLSNGRNEAWQISLKNCNESWWS